MSETSPKISVITICRNNPGLKKTGESVTAQTYPGIEWVVVDGASTDGTPDIIRSFGPRVDTLLSEPDDGIGDAMNKGVRLATGELVTHLHAGDAFCDSEVVARVAEDYAARKWRWAVGGARWLREDGAPGGVQHFAAFSYRRLRLMNYIPHQAAFLERGLFGEIGGFDTSYKIAMDYHFWLRLGALHSPAVLPFEVVDFLLGGASSNYGPTVREERRALREVPWGGPAWRGFEWAFTGVRPAARALFPGALLRKIRAAVHPEGRHPGV